MKEALKTSLTVDMNAGSGWPFGGSFLKPEESLLKIETPNWQRKYIILFLPYEKNIYLSDNYLFTAI